MGSYYAMAQMFAIVSAAFIGVLIFAGIASIVITVIVYRKNITPYVDKTLSIKDKSTWGPFWRFENLLVDKVLKALYIFNSVCIALACALMLLVIIVASFMAMGSDIGTGFLALFLGIIAMVAIFLVLEFLNRISYELVIMFINLCQNISDIRKKYVGAPSLTPKRVVAPIGASVAGAINKATEQAAAYQQAPTAPTAPAQPQDAPEPQDAPGTWTCPECGKTGNVGNFCGGCGHAKP